MKVSNWLVKVVGVMGWDYCGLFCVVVVWKLRVVY